MAAVKSTSGAVARTREGLLFPCADRQTQQGHTSNAVLSVARRSPSNPAECPSPPSSQLVRWPPAHLMQSYVQLLSLIYIYMLPASRVACGHAGLKPRWPSYQLQAKQKKSFDYVRMHASLLASLASPSQRRPFASVRLRSCPAS
jgi:hypothetical protein